MNAYEGGLMTAWHTNTCTKPNTLVWKSLEGKRPYLRRARVHFGANISMKIGTDHYSHIHYSAVRDVTANRPLKFTKMLELILFSGYHGAFSCTRDLRYPYRKKKDLFLCAENQVTDLCHGWIYVWSKGTASPLFLGEILFCFVRMFY